MAFAELVSGFVSPADSKSPAVSAGLFVSGSDKSVPLRLRAVRGTVHCDTAVADVTETLAFIADEDVSVVFKFPLPPRAAVYKLVATVGDRTITTEVKARQEAQQEFDQAVSQGHTAVIAKQESSTQIFTLELGNLEAMQEAVVDISYLRVLDCVGGALEFVHTSTWTPPYLGSAGDAKRGSDVAAEQNPRFASKVEYGLAYDITLLSACGFKAVESPEPVSMSDATIDGSPAKRITLSEQVASPSKDLTLLVELPPLSTPAGSPATDGTASVTLQTTERSGRAKTVALATFVPSAIPEPAAEAAREAGAGGVAAAPPLKQELILIVDGSGSMGGTPIEQAREAALYFIKDLPVGRGLKFNIVAFGSHHITWSPSGCQEFTAQSMASAVTWVQQHVTADLGGTEILETFRAVYNGIPVTPGYSRQIIFLTDGGISGSEEEAVFQLVTAGTSGTGRAGGKLAAGIKSLKDRVLGRAGGGDSPTAAPPADAPAAVKPQLPAVLCLGIGHGVHRGLLDGLASRTGGVAQYVVEGESIARKVGFLKKAALAGAAAIREPRLMVGGALVRAAPHVLPRRLFPGEPVHVLVEIQKCDVLEDVTLTLKGIRGDGSPFAVSAPLKAVTATKGDTYAVLHAMCTVSGLLEGRSHLHVAPDGTPLAAPPSDDAVKAAVVELGTQEHLVTRHTAAVGVMLQKDPLDPTQVKKVEVPLATPHGATLWQQQDQYMHLGGAPMMMACCAMPPPLPCAAPMMAMRCAAAPMPNMPRKKMASGARGMMAMFGSAVPPPPPAPCAAPCFSPAPGGGGAAPMYAQSSALSQPFVMAEACDMAKEAKCSGLAAGAVSMQLECAEGGMLDECMDEECEAVGKGGYGAADMDDDDNNSALPVASRQETAGSTPSEVLALLNLTRNVDGYWVGSDAAVLRAVTSQVTPAGDGAVDAARAGRPAGLSDDQWVTVLALAFLRKHCAGGRGTWEGMETKAMTWLQGTWPAGERSLGMTLLGALKLV